MNDLEKFQKFIDAHSRFTDAIITNVVIKNNDGKNDNIELVIDSENENYKVRVEFDEVIDSKIENIYKYIIWELHLEKEDNFYIFHPIAIVSGFGHVFIKSRKIRFEEL